MVDQRVWLNASGGPAALPGFLTGFVCCALTLTLRLGAQVAAALISLRNWLLPIALAILLAGLAWNTKRLADSRSPADPGAPAT